MVVKPGWLITALSSGPGRRLTPWSSIQLLTVSQSPPAGLIQLMLDNSVRSSSCSKIGRTRGNDFLCFRGKRSFGWVTSDRALNLLTKEARDIAVLLPKV